MDSYLDFILNSDDFDENVKSKLRQLIKIRNVSKGEIIQNQGDIRPSAYFVKRGLLRSYTIDEKGKEHIFMFAPEGWIASDIESTTKEKPATLIIDALEDSVVEVLHAGIFDLIQNQASTSIVAEVPKLLRRIATLQERVIMLMSYTALERYKAFLKKYPQLPQRLPQKMIASYLGITPEALSKIKVENLKSTQD